MTSQSISFDRAAGFYDQTRGFPEGIADEVASLAVELIGTDAKMLEIGIGTGRIAKPLAARGLSVVGVDLSRKMMNRLRETLDDRAAVPASSPRLVEANATRLPFTNASFDAVIAVHVLHLIGDWRAAVEEARRVLRPSGVLLLGQNTHLPNSIQDLRTFMRTSLEAHGIVQQPRGAKEDEAEAALMALGASVEERTTQPWSIRMTIAEDVSSIEQRLWSSLWSVPDDALTAVVAELRHEGIVRFGSLDAEVEVQQTFVWKCFRFQ